MALNRAKVLETADKLVRQGKLDEAIKHYLVLSEDNPRDVNTINRIGDLYVRLRKNKEGIRQFMRIADFYAGDGFHLKAIAMYKKITKLEPTHVEANERLADMYAKQGLVTEARTQFVALAEQCLKAGQKDKALGIYEKVLGLEPGNVKVRLLVAEIHARDGDPARAVEGLLAVAAELRRRNMGEEALKVLQKASRLQPSQPEVLSQMAELLQAAGKNSQEVLGVLESIHRGDPQNQRNLQLLGEAYLGAGRIDDFKKLVVSAAAGEPKIGLLEVEARFFASRREPEKAIEKLKEAAENCLKGGSAERAASLLEQAHQMTPDDPDLLEQILEIWSRATQREGMISAIERLAQLHARREDWQRTGTFLDRLDDLASESSVGRELRDKFAANLRATPGEETLSAKDDPMVPSLDELEKVVELDAVSDEANGSIEDLGFLEIEPADEGELRDSAIDSLPNPLQTATEEDVIGEQEQAYSGKSVIQEMRGEPGKPDLDEDFLSEHLTEAEVFLKYGLVEKAKEQLQAILNRYPDHLPSLMKMKEVFTEEGRKPEAARLALKVAQIYRDKGEAEKATDWEEQARDLDADAASGESAPQETSKGVSEKQGRSKLGAPAEPSPLSLDMDELSIGDASLEPSNPSGSPGSLNGILEEELTIDLVDESDSVEGDETRITDRISQLEFSLQQGLQEEAEEIFRTLEADAPSHPDLVRLRARLGGQRSVAPVPPLPVAGGDLDMDVEMAFGGSPEQDGTGEQEFSSGASGGEDGFFDLAAELRAHAVDSTPEEPGEVAAGLTAGEEESIDEIFKAFRKKVDQQVEEEDYETRYNLGIAYKEMGLLDEAIGEFQYASRDPKLFMECCSILGICFREKGMSDLAVKWYRKALESTGHPEEKTLGLRYDLGELHLERGEHSQALSIFSEVYGINSNYRDVASKIRELKKRVG
jgi:tetratricopeptide (TPR) repeat protein